jgi:hypothetical protein
MNKKMLYALILAFLAVVIIFNVFLKQQPSVFKTGMNHIDAVSGVLS